MPPAAHVASRWQSDRDAWTRHSTRVNENRAYFRNIPTPIQDADRLRRLEGSTEDFQKEMAWDDPLVMAAVVASGEALAGRIVGVDLDRRIPNANGNMVRRPLITIEPSIEFARPTGTKLYLSTSPKVMLEVLAFDPSGVIRAGVVKGPPRIARLGCCHPWAKKSS